MNNLLENNYLLGSDKDVNISKKFFQNKLNKIMKSTKCKICGKTPKEFYICKKTKELACQKCLVKEDLRNKNIKSCNLCDQLIYSKDHFVELPVFNTILLYIDINYLKIRLKII